MIIRPFQNNYSHADDARWTPCLYCLINDNREPYEILNCMYVCNIYCELFSDGAHTCMRLKRRVTGDLNGTLEKTTRYCQVYIIMAAANAFHLSSARRLNPSKS